MGRALNDKSERTASRSVSGIIDLYRRGKISREQALIAIGFRCASWDVSEMRIGAVASDNLRHVLDHPDDPVVELLVAAGGDIATAKRMNEIQPPGRVPWESG
jgi:hypothetical protein